LDDRPSHIPVLLTHVVAALNPRPGEVYLDCTAGLGGHAAAIACVMEADGASAGGSGGAKPSTVILNDADPINLEKAEYNVKAQAPRTIVQTIRANFADVPHKVPPLALRANMLLADLGFASTHVDDPSRGFSFARDGPLDMRMDPTLPISAADVVNGYSEDQIAEIIENFGEDRNARRIARKLVQSRAANPIQTTARLAELVRAASPGGKKKGGHIDPATRTFQALRIAVNDELGSLDALLGAVVREAELLASKKSANWLAAGARIAVISFHSLEDRPVKKAMERLVELGATDLTDGTVTASEDEMAANPRARSAKLRAVRLPG
jgi:16S rRNA (cytosine1402-N4)-methyltransferase